MMKSALAALAFLASVLVTATAAQAADPYVDPAYDWTGFYLGVQAGGVFGEGDVNIPNYPSTFDLNTSGWGAGVYAGYNFQNGPWVLGLEGDANWLDVDGDHLSGLGAELYNIEQDWDATARLRMGYAFNNVLLYATGGVAVSDIETYYTPLAGGKDSSGLVGLTLGGGLELGISPNMSARIQYLYADYGSENFFHNGPSSVDYKTHSVTAGLAWHF